VGRLFRVPVAIAFARPSEQSFEDLPGAVREALNSEATPRRREIYAAGRLAAARATALATGSESWLTVTASGAPAWPDGLAGAISHTNELALCVVASSDGFRLGVDIEPQGSADGLCSAARLICTPAEQERVTAAADPATAVLRLFCAKEALYKALPHAQQRGWRPSSVELRWHEPSDASKTTALLAGASCWRGPRAAIMTALLGDHMAAGVVRPCCLGGEVSG
jgi:4'-phosphopantetheinyl transferase EntD